MTMFHWLSLLWFSAAIVFIACSFRSLKRDEFVEGLICAVVASILALNANLFLVSA